MKAMRSGWVDMKDWAPAGSAVCIASTLILAVTIAGAALGQRREGMCERLGGTYLNTREGYACIKAERIRLP